MGVEVDHRYPACADDIRTSLCVGVGDRMVPAQREWYRASLSDLLNRGLERWQCDFDVTGVHLNVTGVVDLEVLQAVGPQCQRGSRSVVRQVVGHSNCLRTEAGAGPIGGAAVERRPQDHDVRVGVATLVLQVAFRHPKKSEVGTELSTVTGHDAALASLAGCQSNCFTRMI